MRFAVRSCRRPDRRKELPGRLVAPLTPAPQRATGSLARWHWGLGYWPPLQASVCRAAVARQAPLQEERLRQPEAAVPEALSQQLSSQPALPPVSTALAVRALAAARWG